MGAARNRAAMVPRSVSLSQAPLLQMSDFDPHNVEATLSYEIESPRLQYEHGGEAIDKLLNGFDSEGPERYADAREQLARRGRLLDGLAARGQTGPGAVADAGPGPSSEGETAGVQR